MDILDLVKLMTPILASCIGSVILLWQKLNRNQEKLFGELHSLREMIQLKLDIHTKEARSLELRVLALEHFKEEMLKSGLLRRRENE